MPYHPDALAAHPVDPATLNQAIREYRAGRRQGALWSSVLGLPLGIFLVGAGIAIAGGPIAGGLFIALVGGLLSWYPARKMVRGYQRYYRARPVIRSYEEALGAAQPSPYQAWVAVNRWRRDHDLVYRGRP